VAGSAHQISNFTVFGGASGGLTEGTVSFLAFGLLFLLPGIFMGVRSFDEDMICEGCCCES
jgi:hypothetical protein